MNRAVILTSTLFASFTAFPVFAHTGAHESSSWIAGLTHPFTGIDHLLAMFAFGIWIAFQNRSGQITLGAAYVITLLTGFMLAITGVGLPMIEGGIAASVLILGLLVATKSQYTLHMALPLTATFAMFHGYAHGAEAGSAVLVLFATGFILSSAVIALAGSLTARLAKQHLPAISQFIGILIAMMGLSFIIA